jgi:hypothetical protein
LSPDVCWAMSFAAAAARTSAAPFRAAMSISGLVLLRAPMVSFPAW